MSTLTLTAPPSVGIFYPPEEDLAVADKVAQLAEEEQRKVLEGMEPELLLHDFSFWGRPSQLRAIESCSHIIAMLSGRGSGKTRTLAEWVHKKAMGNPGCRIALVGRTVADVRDTIVNGESGLLAVAPEHERPNYVPSNRAVTWPNGSVATTFSAEKPDQLRGPQFHYAAADELAAWPSRAPGGGLANAWDNLKIATRLGDAPQIFVASTPRRVPMIVEILNSAWAEERDGVPEDKRNYTVIRGSTYANRHLSSVYRDTITSMYEGTSLARQELGGELLGAVDGALWAPEMIDAHRFSAQDEPDFDPLTLPLRVIGVDPSVSDKPNDECGIVAMAATFSRNPYKRHGYVLEDGSLQGPPGKWAERVVNLARKYRAFVCAEDNNGGEMVRMVIKAIDPEVPVILVRSSKSKQVRAEPIVLSYEQGRTHHIDFFGELESQMTSWEPEVSTYSPDRLDALVIAATALLVARPKGMSGSITIAQGRANSTPIHRRELVPSTRSASTAHLYRPRARTNFSRN